MATSGSKSVKVTDWDTLKFSWSEKSQSITNNTTTISWTLQLVATEYGYISSSASKTWNVTVNGTNYSGTTSVGINNNSTKTLASGTTTIAHSNDGTKTFNYSFSQAFDITFNGWVGTVSGSGSGTLDTIPRKSSLTVSNGTLGTAMTLTISAKASTFKHKIEYGCGSYAGYAAGSASSYAPSTTPSWTPPLTFANTNTTGTSVSVDLYLYTYTSEGTNIGYEKKTITCAIPASVKPSCNFTLEDVTGIDAVYGSPVQGLSKIKVKVSTTLAYSSPITSYAVTIDGTKYTTAENTTGALKKSGDSVVTATVKDKRGRSSAAASYTMKVQAYTPAAVSKLTVHRCDADGKLNDRGSYLKAVFSAAVTSLGSKNTAEYKLRYKKTSATSYTTQNFTALSNTYTVTNHSVIFAAELNSSYDVEVTATDRHGSSTRSTQAPTAFTLINWGADGTSMAIGKVAEKGNTLEVALGSHFYGDTVQEGNRYSFSSPGTAGSTGYILMARLTHKAANADTPLTFVFSRRLEASPMTVHVQFKSNSTTVDPDIQGVTYEGSNYGAFLVKSATSVWDLYVEKVSAHDTVTLQDWYSSGTLSAKMDVTFPGSLISTLPQPYYRATPLMARSILDYVYPVGSVYISYSHHDPADLFGGTWVRITNAFLWATTAGGTIGQTGGEQTHTLTANELPSHRHGITVASTAAGSVSVGDTVRYNGSTTSYKGTLYTENTGEGVAHNNMPPYIQVSMWRRTA